MKLTGTTELQFWQRLMKDVTQYPEVEWIYRAYPRFSFTHAQGGNYFQKVRNDWFYGKLLGWMEIYTAINSCTWFIMACMYGVTRSLWYTPTKSLPHCLALSSYSLIAVSSNSFAGLESILFSVYRCWIQLQCLEFTSGSSIWMFMLSNTFNFSGPVSERHLNTFDDWPT